jgi:A/G-specific adenine glycosylase
MAELPTVQALAAAPEDQVLTLWSGLGYYSRARNLHAAAGEIVTRYGGRFPREPEAVRALPGIGPYTAGAILSIAFAQRAPILDGNVIRVLARLRTLGERPDSAAGKRLYWSLAEALVPPPRTPSSGEAQPGADEPAGDVANDPGDFNQSLMELGATVCLPQRPVCLVCPLAELCQARLTGDPEAYPPKKEARAVPVVEVAALVVRSRGRVLLCRRPSLGLWGGLWEPPTLNRPPGEPPPESIDATLRCLVAEQLGIELATGHAVPLQPFVHVLSHRELRFQPFLLEVEPDAAPAPSPESDAVLERRIGGYTARRWINTGEPLALGLAAWVTALLRRVSA